MSEIKTIKDLPETEAKDFKSKNPNAIFTVSNVITIIRILLIPLFMYYLLNPEFPKNIQAFLVFVLASASDGLDGFIARKTNTCTKLGKVLDPLADRLLLICAAIALTIIGRLPLWILILILLRDLLFLIGGWYLIKINKIQIDVILLGKIATAIMYIGFALLILNWPLITDPPITTISWLPCYYVGIYFVYASIILNIISFVIYVKTAITKYKDAKRSRQDNKHSQN